MKVPAWAIVLMPAHLRANNQLNKLMKQKVWLGEERG